MRRICNQLQGRLEKLIGPTQTSHISGLRCTKKKLNYQPGKSFLRKLCILFICPMNFDLYG